MMSEYPSSVWQNASVEIRAYWESLRRDGQVPLRADIDPREIEAVLPYAFILERIASQVARFRVAGQHLAQLMGSDARGMPLTTCFLPGSRDRVAATLEQVFRGPEIAELDLRAPGGLTGFGRRALTGRMILLPLCSDLGDVTRALGCLVTSDVTGRAPRRCDIENVTVTPVVAGRPALSTAPERTQLRLVEGFASALRLEERSARAASHLRLVSSLAEV